MVGQFSRFIRRGSTNYKIIKGNEGNHLTPNQFNALAARNPDNSWAIVFVNNMNRTENVRIAFTESGTVWEGVVANATVTTWILPSDENGPWRNGTAFGAKRIRNSTCELPPTTAVSTTSTNGGSESTPLLPVPHTDHVIPQNEL